MRIETRIADNQYVLDKENFAFCPNCNQKLTQLELVKGFCRQRTLCRRCGYIIEVTFSD